MSTKEMSDVTYGVLPAIQDGTHQYNSVVVGAEPLTTVIDRKSFNDLVFVGIVILVIILIVLIIIAVIAIFRRGSTGFNPFLPLQIPASPLEISINDDPGRSIEGSYWSRVNGSVFKDLVSCQTSPRREWNPAIGAAGSCDCRPPYWGPACERETHNYNYYGAGRDNGLEIMTLGTKQTSNLSFGDNSCTDWCDQTPNCHGVKYEQGKCTLLEHVALTHPSNLPYHPNVQSNIFLKRDYYPTMKDAVVVYEGGFPRRYWLDGENHHLIRNNDVAILSFYPTSIFNPNRMTGIWSIHPYNLSDINVLSPPQDIYIHYPNRPLRLPPDWRHYRTFYALYRS